MNASKENATKSLRTMSVLTEMIGKMCPNDMMAQEACARVMEFLKAAEKRLPREGTIKKNRQRRGKNVT